MNSDVLIIVLAVATLVLVAVVAMTFRARVAKQKRDGTRSAFTEAHGEAPRAPRPGTDAH